MHDRLVDQRPQLATTALHPALTEGNILADVEAVCVLHRLKALQQAALEPEIPVHRGGLLYPQLGIAILDLLQYAAGDEQDAGTDPPHRQEAVADLVADLASGSTRGDVVGGRH